jgi:radical SAM family uncharacterized protein
MFDKIEPYLYSVEKPGRYVGEEMGAVKKQIDEDTVRFLFAFPDIYDIGMSFVGMQILYGLLNEMDNVYCERTFAPWVDMEKLMRDKNIPLYSLETKTNASDFDILGFTLQYEMSYTNILNMLDLGNIPIESKDRDDSMPIVVAGGPCAFNPEPIWDIIDVFFIGDAEEVLPEFINLYKNSNKDNWNRDDFLIKAANIEGIYVPKFHDVKYNEDGTIKERIVDSRVPKVINKAMVKDLNESFYPESFIVPYVDIVHDRVSMEIFRGCTRGCRFCQAGMLYRPIRERTAETILKQSKILLENSGYEEISLSSLSTSDHSEIQFIIRELMDYCYERKIGLSLPSLRLDGFPADILEKINEVKKTNLTFAPEAGTQRLRDVINKGITEDDLITAAREAFERGWSTVKLYFMMGLPSETMEDLEGIKILSYKVKDLFFNMPKEERRGNLKINTSVSCFVPKPFTPFQWIAQDTIEMFEEKQNMLSKEIRDRKVSLSMHDPRTSVMEGVFARGDRKLSNVIKRAWKKGCRFDSWSHHFKYDIWMEAFKEEGIDTDFYTTRERGKDELFPWDFINAGVSKKFLYNEYEKSFNGDLTSDCRKGCKNCGIIEHYGKEVCNV